GPEHPPSPDYLPGLEEPKQAPLSPDYILEPEYPEYLAPSDVEAPIEDQPLPEDFEEDPADYSVDGGDDDDDESSIDDDDDDDDGEEQEDSKDDDEEEEEHPSLTDSSAVPIDDPVPSAEDTEAFKTDESAPTPIPSPRPPPSPHSPLSSPLPHIPSPPLPLSSPPTTSHTYAEASLGYKAVGIQLRAASQSTHHPSKIPSPPLLLPSTSHRDATLKVDMPLRKRARFIAPAFRFEVGERSAAAAARQPVLDVATVDATLRRLVSRDVGYGIEDVWEDIVGDMEERALTTVEVLSQRVTDLSTTLARDTYEIYVRLEDA
ncbi:hypothetical protein Tco_0620614, partial [Tanacetum coccineum]